MVNVICAIRVLDLFQCGINMDRYEHDYDPNFRTELKHPITKPSMDIGEPCMVNPSSFEALLEVMDHVELD